MAEPRLMLVTGLWPTIDRQSAGTFVRDRTKGLRRPIVVAPNRYDRPMPIRYLLIAWRALATTGHIDGVEAHVLFPAGLIGLAAARLRRVPLVTYAHGADVRETAVQNRLYRFMAGLVIKGSAVIAPNSSDTADLVARLGGKAIVIPLGVDLLRFTALPRPAERRVLYLGGLEERKGYDVARRWADTMLGPGLETAAPTDVPALMAAHDIILVPSRAEPYGMVAAEAIASGRWVVARRVGGLSTIVEDGVTGTLVDSDDQFAAAIASVPDYDPATVAARGARFSLEHSNAALNAVWERLLGRKVVPTREAIDL
jgi:glycogen(starch) synthase